MAASPSLTISRLELPNHFRNCGLAQNIAVVFPALKRLKIGFSLRPENEDVMKVIFETMTNLEELDIRTDMDEMNENIDHVLVGIPKSLSRKIRQDQSYLSPNCLESVDRTTSLVNMKSMFLNCEFLNYIILNFLYFLIDLRRLDIVLDNNRAPYITDVAGYLAFMQMPKLKILRFTRYGVCIFETFFPYRTHNNKID
jgi:hypothetical protein